MTTLETSLNTAHQFQRKADVFLKAGKYKEAIDCHQKAAEFVSDALANTQSARAKESLLLQRDFHLRQQAVVQYKQQRVEAIKKAQERNKTFTVRGRECFPGSHLMTERQTEDLQQTIYKIMGERDSLLCTILTDLQNHLNEKQGPDTDLELLKDLENTIKNGVKFPKDTQMKIEELNVKNEELRKLVDDLLQKNERLALENEILHRRVDELERHIAGTSGRRLTLLADGESPYVCSPFSDLSPGLSRDLPQLAPLELPKFDFSAIKSNLGNSSK